MPPRKRINRAALDARRAEALTLRLSGLSYRAIAERTCVSHVQARTDVADAIEQIHAEWTLDRAHFKTLMMCRLDALLFVWWPLSIADPPDPTAADIVLNVMDMQARVMGLLLPTDAPPEPNHAV